MNELMWVKDYYWAHRDVCRALFAVAAVALFHLGLLLVVVRRLRDVSQLSERISRLADSLALLTDTTEAGLSAIVRDVQQIGRRAQPTRTAGRRAVAKRVAAAASQGEPPAAIAASELLSEGEVRLHLSLAEAAAREGRGAVRL